MKIVNNELSRKNDENMFVTAFLCIINVKTGRVIYTNAGHNPPYVIPCQNRLKKLDKRHGPVLGAVDGLEYGEDEFHLTVGETLVLYTDGVTEAFNISRQMYTEKRLESLLTDNNFAGTEPLVTMVMKDIVEFEDDTEQTDDITVMAVQKI
jgi:sigma-B regulation protein RsbU (phosphoserine phosphatase)